MKAVSVLRLDRPGAHSSSLNAVVFEAIYIASNQDGPELYAWMPIFVIESEGVPRNQPGPATLVLRAREYAHRNKLPFKIGLYEGSTEGLDPMTLLSMTSQAEEDS